MGRRGAVFWVDGWGTRASGRPGPTNGEEVVTWERRAMGGGLVRAEELTGFHKLEDLETRRCLAEKVQEACRKCLRGDARNDCRGLPAIGSSVKRFSCACLVVLCTGELLAA